MPERPLLLFAQPEEASRSNLFGGHGSVTRPSQQRQIVRLTPMFDQLQTAFESRRVEIQHTTAGIDSDQVLVIETIGSIENFAIAVKRIDGFEWMGEFQVDDITPDKDFFDEANPEKELSGRLYLVMTNHRALDEMLSLWRRYQADQGMQFQRGLTKFRDVFLHLKAIRRWDVQDRLLETGVIEAWRQDLEHNGDLPIRFEAELWFRHTSEKRLSSQSQVESHVNQLGGQILSECVVEEIAYHGVLAELPANSIRDIVSDSNINLVKCDSVMFFRAVGQMSSGDRPADGDFGTMVVPDMPLPDGRPVVAVLDGLPLANHELLANRLIIDDPDDWESAYAALEQVHGTRMASLVVHGDLNDGVANPLTTPVYVRPIMTPDPQDFLSPRREHIPGDVLAVDLIHRAVRRIFEGEAGDKAVAPSVKIINLSIGDPYRQFTEAMSPMARLLDWLSAKYNILFVISAGNHPTPLSLGMSRDEFWRLQPADVEAATIRALYRDARHRKLLAPAESINGITVGAVHFDNSLVVPYGDRIDPYEATLPSPISSFGSGYQRGIKPDIVFIGGKQLYREPPIRQDPMIIEPAIFVSPPGNKVASPGSLAGGLSDTAYCSGTSNAAALVSRTAVICHDSLVQILLDQATVLDYSPFVAPLLKAMLVHGCAWREIGHRISDVLRTPENGRQLKKLVSRWLGYGNPQIERVLSCTEQRVALIGFGSLSNGQAHVFRLPLPPSLASKRELRRLTVTLAWISPISPNTQKYRTAGLWFETRNNDLAPKRNDADRHAVMRGTVQHEVFEGEQATPFPDGDSIEIKVNCRNDAGIIELPVPYGVVVSLEVSEGVDIAVYDEVRARISLAVQIQESTRAD
jgi:hypothetical protein